MTTDDQIVEWIESSVTYDKSDPQKHLFRGYPGRPCWDCGMGRGSHVEPTCPKCLDVVELSGHPETARYTMDVVNPDGSTGSIAWKVYKAHAMVKADPRPARRLDSESLAAWLESHAADIVTEHLDHIPVFPERSGSDPGLMVVIDEIDPDDTSRSRPMPILIDGTHRAARALRNGESFFVYVLDDREMLACLTDVTGTAVGIVDGTPADLSETGMQA